MKKDDDILMIAGRTVQWGQNFINSQLFPYISISQISMYKNVPKPPLGFKLGFPTGRDSATFRDKGTENPSLSRDKGTTGQAQNLATGRDGILNRLSRPGTQSLSILNIKRTIFSYDFLF